MLPRPFTCFGRNWLSMPVGFFVFGHSLGGTVAPRVAAAEPSVAGLVIMAGGTQPLHWAAVRQTRYLTAVDPETAATLPSIEAMTRAAILADSPDLSPRRRPASCPSARLRRTGWTCAATSQSRSRLRLASRCSSFRAGATAKPPSPTTSLAGGPVSPTARMSRSASTTPTTTCSSPTPARRRKWSTCRHSTWTLPSSRMSPAG
jgi:pimeloyl-ACP methyl ester carboxylesterase